MKWFLQEYVYLSKHRLIGDFLEKEIFKVTEYSTM